LISPPLRTIRTRRTRAANNDKPPGAWPLVRTALWYESPRGDVKSRLALREADFGEIGLQLKKELEMAQLVSRNGVLSVLAMMSAICMGCGGGSNEKLAKVYSVDGIVKYQGKPVEGATITFTATGSDPRTSFGKSDANGEFNVTTFTKDDGAVVGTHAVTVKKVEMSEPDATGIMPPEKQLLPERYGDLGTSPLTAEITEKGPNKVELILE
jgi:hypothetical protein